jgi:hypothetical protein
MAMAMVTALVMAMVISVRGRKKTRPAIIQINPSDLMSKKITHSISFCKFGLKYLRGAGFIDYVKNAD